MLPAWDYLALATGVRREGLPGRDGEPISRRALAEIRDLEGVPALVEVVIPEKDLAPQLARLAAPPPPQRKYGRARDA